MARTGRYEIDMCSGKLLPKILTFALPRNDKNGAMWASPPTKCRASCKHEVDFFCFLW